jgi:preprotein translocase subunit SecY
LERLAREGDAGRQKLTQYTRYLTVLICIVQGIFLAMTLLNPGSLGLQGSVVTMSSVSFVILATVCVTTGSMLIMWLGEQITQRGIGNGISLIITVGIVSRLPRAIAAAWQMFTTVGTPFTLFHLVGLLIMLFLVIAGTIAVTQGQRKIMIQYAKRVVGNKVYGGQNTYMPLRINYSGVMPIIFAQSILMFPAILFKKIDLPFFQRLGDLLAHESALYMVLYGLMILFFSYFWVATQFHPVQIADDLKKHGGYVPGIRPGRATAEYLDNTMTRITLAGAVFLTMIAVIPTLLATKLEIPWIVAAFFGGTSLLIMVGVMLDTMRQIESHLLMRHYDGFLTKGRLRGRR